MFGREIKSYRNIDDSKKSQNLILIKVREFFFNRMSATSDGTVFASCFPSVGLFENFLDHMLPPNRKKFQEDLLQAGSTP